MIDPLVNLSARQRNVLQYVRRLGFVSTLDLASEFEVSDMTVRRDTKALAEEGLVRVVHGGVTALDRGHRIPGFSERGDDEMYGKQRVGAAAAALVASHNAVVIDSGTTAHQVALHLPDDFAGTFISHSFPALQRSLQLRNARTIGLGGELLHDSEACIGGMTVSALSKLRAHFAFVGVSGIHDGSFYIERDLERPTKLAIMRAAEQVVVVATAAKFDHMAPIQLCSYADVDVLVTDMAPSPQLAAQLAREHVRVIVAETDSVLGA
jgi:DeoR/GlpR family transcriptional regulator of sugar metabolism